MKVAIYTRCSSEIQENLDRSIPAQLGALRDYVSKKGYRIYKEYIEPGESAYRDDENREKFHQMIEDSRERKFDAVLVHRFNRFYRDQYKSMFYKKILRDYGIKVISITEEFNPETIQGFMLERMIEMMDQVSSMQNAWETFKGMKENAMQGFKNGGRAPYGYKRVQIPIDIGRPNPRYKIKWEIDPETSKVVKKIFNYRLKGNSVKRIATLLNSEMIPSPTGSWWCASTLRYIFQRADVYAGDYIWNLWNMKNVGQKFKDSSEWIIAKDVHPAIISREVAEKIRIAIGGNYNKKYKYVPVYNSKFLLSGKNIFRKPFFICTNCGDSLSGYNMKASKIQNHKIYPKYICSNFHRIGKVACDKPQYLGKDWIENIVIDEIDKRYNSQEAIEEIARRLSASKSTEEKEIENKIKSVNRQIKKTKDEIEALFAAIYSGADKDLIVPKSKELSQKVKDLESKKEGLLMDRDSSGKFDIELIKNFFSDFKNIIEHGDNEQKSSIIKSYINRILFNPDKEEITIEFFEIPQDKKIITTTKCGGGTWYYANVVTLL